MKKLLFALAITASLASCDTNTAEPGTLEKLQGDWYGVEITNHLIAQGLWDTIHPQSITMMTLGIDTLTSTAIVDSAGITLDTAALVVNNDSSITVTGNTSNLGWAFDADLISAFGQPVLDSLRVLFTGEQRFHVHMLTEDELRELHTCKHCGACGDELAQVTRAFDDALDAVRRAAVGNEPFLCAHIESTLAERDVGRDAIEREAAAVEQGREALDALTGGWEALAIEEPESLEGRLEEEVRLARDALHHFLAAKCKPDLEHVMSSVMETFDARVADETKRAVFRNRTAAASHNRSLRMELIQEYKECIAEQVALGDDAIGQDASSTPHPTPRQRFNAVYVKFAELVVRFATRSKGGTLAWQPLVVLQDQLRMEQVDTREKILRTELKSGAALPDISAPIKEASALVKVFGDQPVPTWVLKMLSGDQERSGPGGGGSRSCAAGHAIRPATG